MAKRRAKRKFKGRLIKITTSSAVGALASLDVVTNAITAVSANKYRALSFNCSYSWSNKSIIDDGAAFGLAHSDYNAAEIEECLEANTAIDQGNKTEQEKANRLVREIGTFGSGGMATDGGGVMFNNGEKVRTRLNWLMGIGDTVTLWIRNSSGTVYTTGSNITMNGDLHLVDQ